MTYFVACLTLDSAGSNVMQGAFFTQGMIPSIPIGGSISPEGTKKYRGLNSSDGGNTGDGVKIAGGVIGSHGEIAAEANLGYYFMETTIIIIENVSKETFVQKVNEARDPVMSSSSTVTYTSIYTNSEPGRVFWGANEELSDRGPEHPSSPDYVPGPEHPPSPVEVPYVPEPEYPEYLVPNDVEAPLEDQSLPINASPTTLSPGYVADSDPDEDSEEDPEENHVNYPTDRGDDDDEPSDDDDDDDDTDDEDEEPFEDEDDDEEEEEHLAPDDSSVVPVVDLVPLAGDTEAFETDESAPTPISPQTKVPFAQTCLRRAQKTIRLEPPMSPSMKARIVKYAAAPTPPSPPPSPLP
ncbi:hypothetical protein Tco_1006161 [Tanacetum coccineum]|uniref:Dirigent protein n=1 Tax=Tanacetum coccineum TaxID=301880 RepID=A0ABQ5FIB2_9ASTR